jgi:Holliday junction resolvase
MKNTYAKGARFERDLIHYLNSKDFSVLRVPSSGGFLSPIDIVAMKKGLIVAIECKSWNRKPKLEKEQLRRFKEWSDRAGAMGFLAWRKPGNKWLFLRIEDAELGKYEDENWFAMENVLSALDFR